MIRPALALAAGLVAAPALAQDRPSWRLDLEAGASFPARNDVRIPSSGGTQFDLNRLQGSPASPLVRASVAWDPFARHGFVATYQYLRNEGTGALSATTSFAGQSFAGGARTEGRYRFDTWRLTYRYSLVQTDSFRLRLGVTGLIRDAEIRLRQNGRTARDADVGFVPLLHAAFDWRFAPGWTLLGEVDGLGASQGYAVDAGLRVARDLGRNWQASLGWRTLDGGVDNDTVRNFARFHSVTAGLAYRF